MGIAQRCWQRSQTPIATVNKTLYSTEKALLQSLKKLLYKKSPLVEIGIHDLAAQRVLLPLAVYSPKDLLPPNVGELVEDMLCDKLDKMVPIGRTLEVSLAMAQIMQDSQNPVVVVVGAAVLYALGQGYGTISFSTTPTLSASNQSSGAVLIRISR